MLRVAASCDVPWGSPLFISCALRCCATKESEKACYDVENTVRELDGESMETYIRMRAH
jgi:hypothetical protein